MSNKLKYKSFVKFLLVILFLAILFNISSFVSISVYAETPNSTNVLSDLQKDPNFKVSDYRDKSDDYSIQIISIAESTAKELFIYTYQPCQRTKYLVATCVNMSLSEKVTGTNLYNLELVSQETVFCKYKVLDLKVSDNNCRYYNITSIYRAWNEDIDDPSGNDNIINEVAYAVGKLYKASTIDGKVSYSYDKMETIEIVNPYVDFLQYSNGFQLYESACRSHYIAFDTDKPIDELMEADVYFVSQGVIRKIGGMTGDKFEYGENIEQTKTLKGTDKGENPANGFLARKYEWKRIEKTVDFIEKEDLKESTKNNIKNTKWVLRFVETDYTYKSGASSGITIIDTEEYTNISNVSILRLKFRTGIRIYDLGVISNKITGDDVPGNNNTNEYAGFFEWLWRKICEFAEKLGIPVWALILIIVLIFLAILLPILGLIFPVVGQALKIIFKAICKLIKWLFNALVWIITLPIKCIVWIINKCKGGGSA